ncbi:MAG: serine/threonine protein kinase [Bacteroidetes bacterium]|nr:serine/threonine protein kinase [Bacteroidota bacterium]
MINTSIAKYRITKLIGEGGMASVYEGEHEMLGTKVAIKVLNPILSANAQIRERFRNEARLMATLDHPNITRVIDFDEQPQHLSIIMEYLDGEDLSKKIKRSGPLAERALIDTFSQTLSAFQYAHEKGIVHRDIKPSNIFILSNGQVKILDFGIAKLFGQGNDMTQTGTQMGTPVYMSPEQVKGDRSIDHRSDIYSLGVTFYFALNGKPPYNANTESQFDIFSKIVYEPLPEISQSHSFKHILSSACHKNREERYQSCNEWLIELKLPLTSADKLSSGQSATVPLSNERVPVKETPQADQPTAPASALLPFILPPRSNPLKPVFIVAGILGALILLIVVISNLGASEGEAGAHTTEVDSLSSLGGGSATTPRQSAIDTFATAKDPETAPAPPPEPDTKTTPEESERFFMLENDCGYEDNDSYVYVTVDGKSYAWGDEIQLNNGSHFIRERIIAISNDEVIFEDNTNIQISDRIKNYSTITVELNCLACPFFYYKGPTEFVYGGELIRNLNSIEKEQLDCMRLQEEYLQGDTLHLLVSEEKKETSYLDEVYLIVNDSIRIEPASATKNIQQLISSRDGNYTVMKMGDTFDLYFVIPSEVQVRSAKIYSYGYYIRDHQQ